MWMFILIIVCFVTGYLVGYFEGNLKGYQTYLKDKKEAIFYEKIKKQKEGKQND